MQESFKIASYKRKAGEKNSIEFLSENVAQKVNQFHESFPQYKKTPLVHLTSTAKELGLKDIFLKDESYRFGLNAFKVLGGSFAIGQYLAQKLGKDISALPFAVMTSDEVKKQIGEITFVTATDGNHGRGVAWTANRLGQKSIVYMPKAPLRNAWKIYVLKAQKHLLQNTTMMRQFALPMLALKSLTA